MKLTDVSLEKVVQETEDIFGRIAEHYPELLGSLESGIKTAEALIQNLSIIQIPGGKSEYEKSKTLLSYIDEQKSSSRNYLLELDENKKKDQDITDRLTSSIQEYADSQSYIDEIREISESLQIVSLNALINAVRAGKGGEGFSVITDNLKKVTGDTINNTDLLELKGKEVKRHLDEFLLIDKALSEDRKVLLDTVERQIMANLDTFQNESEIISTLLLQLRRESDEVRSYILRIMQELQQQDIIRQTIDQILLSIKELPEFDPILNSAQPLSDEQMDRVMFGLRLIDLAVSMVEEVTERLNATIRVFLENFNNASTKLESIQADKSRAVSSFEQKVAGIGMAKDIFLKLQNNINSLSEKRREHLKIITEILSHVRSISDDIVNFEKISDWLQNVTVLSRIELTKSRMLSEMVGSVDDMTELVTRIQEQIKDGQKFTGKFIGTTGEIYSEYNEYLKVEKQFLGLFTKDVEVHSANFHEINVNFSSTLNKLNFFTREFKDLFSISVQEMEDLKILAKDMGDVINQLSKLKKTVEPVYLENLKNRGLSEWRIENDSLNTVIDKFTIYTHKKTAGDISGFEVEESALEAGEITLF